MGMIVAIGLTKRFGGQPVLQDLNLSVGQGEMLALCGGNGAGKSTTLACFLGFVAPDAGQALIAGHDIQRDPQAAKAHVGYLPENVMLYGQASGIDNLRYFAELYGRQLDRSAASQLLGRMGLAPGAHDQAVRHYSKGMRQKTGLAIAVAHDAGALFLDEPYSGLDPLAASELTDLLRQLKAEGRALLTVTHDLLHANRAADRIGILGQGRLQTVLRGGTLADAELEQVYLETMRAGKGDSCDTLPSPAVTA